VSKPTDAVILEWLFAWEVMRRLGFPSAELFFLIAKPGTEVLQPDGSLAYVTTGTLITLHVIAQDKTFDWTIGETPLSPDEAIAAHGAAVSWWLTLSLPEWRASGYFSSRVLASGPSVAMALVNKGFVLPKGGAWA
jgi:hypothetical protein